MITINFWMGVLTGVAIGICIFFIYVALRLEKIEKNITGGDKNGKN